MFFATFPRPKKVRRLPRARVRSWPRTGAHPRFQPVRPCWRIRLREPSGQVLLAPAHHGPLPVGATVVASDGAAVGEPIVVSLCHRSRPAVDVERAQFVDSDMADSVCTVERWIVGSRLPRWIACGRFRSYGELMDNWFALTVKYASFHCRFRL